MNLYSVHFESVTVSADSPESAKDQICDRLRARAIGFSLEELKKGSDELERKRND